MWSVWPLLIESALILLQTVPTHIDIEKLKRKLLENIDGILAVSKIVISYLRPWEFYRVVMVRYGQITLIDKKLFIFLGSRISRLAASWRPNHSISAHTMSQYVRVHEGMFMLRDVKLLMKILYH